MQSDPQDEQWTLPESGDGQPAEPDGSGADMPADPGSDVPGAPPDRSPAPGSLQPAGEAPADAVDEGDATGAPEPAVPPPPRMPVAPRMPGPRSGVHAWGTAAPPTADAAPDGAGSAGMPPPPEDAPRTEIAGPEPVSPVDGAVTPPAAHSVAPVVEGGDWLATVCPYLTSEDGSYRSAEPDEGHRCVAVDPPATLPLAFQARFCLTDRHPRCEMYKYAQEVGQDGGVPVPATQLREAASRPVHADGIVSGSRFDRRTAVAAASAIGVVLLVLLLVLLMGSCAGGGAPVDSPEPGATEVAGAGATVRPTPRATPTPAPATTGEPDASAAASTEPRSGGPVTILYEIQEDEALLKVADTFGITRKRILRANPELEEVAPADLPGMVIEIPLPDEMPLEEAEALPGYQGLAS